MTDEEWFLRFYNAGETGNIETTDGQTIASIAIPMRRTGSREERNAQIRAQYHANVRVMAAAREMLATLKRIAADPTNADIEAQNAIALAEPPLFNATRDGEVHFNGTHNECFEYILKHQGQSVDYAMEHGGWKIVDA